MRALRSESQAFQCCFPMTEILRTTYAACMKLAPMAVHEQYVQVSVPSPVRDSERVQMRKMLIEWLIEGGEQLRLSTRTIFHAIVLHDRFMARLEQPLDF